MNAAMFTWLEAQVLKFEKWIDNDAPNWLRSAPTIYWYKYEYFLPGGGRIVGELWKVPLSTGGYSELLYSDKCQMVKDELQRVRHGLPEGEPVIVKGTNGDPVILPTEVRKYVVVALVEERTSQNTGPK